MRILFVTHRLPFPPSGGAKIRAFHCIRYLHEQGHEVTVAAPARDTHEAVEGQGLADYCSHRIIETMSPLVQSIRTLASLATPWPASVGYFNAPALKRRVQEGIHNDQYDLIFVHCSSVAHYVLGTHKIPRILDYVDMDSQKWLDYAGFHRFPKSWGYWLEGAKMRRLEAQMAHKFDLSTVITPGELELLEGLAPGAQADWFPNGVDKDAFSPAHEPPKPDSLCFTGRMDYYPNICAMTDFCRDVLPLIQKQRPNVTLTIIGAEPSAEVKALGDLPGVTVTGTVPEVQPYVRESAVAIAPLTIARGTQNKVLEAMAMGLPTVASPLAAKGVDAVPGEHLLVADTPRQWRDAILSLLSNPEQAITLGAAGRERVLIHHSWKTAMSRVETLMDRCIRHFESNI